MSSRTLEIIKTPKEESMSIEEAMDLKPGNKVFYAGSFYIVAEIKEFPHGIMIGIYDEPNTKHIDYLQPNGVNEVYHCYACQGGGCPVCGGYGVIVQQ